MEELERKDDAVPAPDSVSLPPFMSTYTQTHEPTEHTHTHAHKDAAPASTIWIGGNLNLLSLSRPFGDRASTSLRSPVPH